MTDRSRDAAARGGPSPLSRRMTRRDRLIHILDRLKFPHCDLLYQASTTRDLEEYARNALWWLGLARHNARVMSRWWSADFAKDTAQPRAAAL